MSKKKPYPETTIEATVKVTYVINDQMDKKQAEELLHDILDESEFDDMKIKDVKVFQREVTK